MKRAVRHLESVFRRHRFARCHSRSAAVRYHQMLGIKQRSFWSGRLLENSGNSRVLWKTLSGLMSPPVTKMTCITPAEFVAHFKGKVDAICASTTEAPPPMAGYVCSASLSSYNRVTAQDIQRLLSQCPNKQCVLDPVPTWLVKAAGTSMTSILHRRH